MVLKSDYERSLLIEGVMWHQNVQIQWLKEEDRNTRFFHKMASCWKSSNGTNRRRVGEDLVDRLDVIRSQMEHHFWHLYTED